jgi:hypothetical protein
VEPSKARFIQPTTQTLEKGTNMSMIGNYLEIDEQKLASLYENPETISSVLYEEYSEQILDIDKSWHGIHFLLTGAQYGGQPPLSNVVFGVMPIGAEDVGYGPAMGTPASTVNAIAEALSAITDDEFRSKFDIAALGAADIYPQIWNEGQEALEYLVANFRELRDFYMKAAGNGNAVITFIN